MDRGQPSIVTGRRLLTPAPKKFPDLYLWHTQAGVNSGGGVGTRVVGHALHDGVACLCRRQLLLALHGRWAPEDASRKFVVLLIKKKSDLKLDEITEKNNNHEI